MTKDETNPHNYVVMTDIHGCVDELKEMLELTINEHECHDHTFIFLGDYCDRGPDSKGVLDLLISFEQKYPCIFLRGNHDDMFINGLNDREYYGMALMNGFKQTQDSFGVSNIIDIPRGYFSWMKETQLYYRTPNFYFVHAGINPYLPLNQQLEEDQLWIRGEFLDYEGRYEKSIVHGHTPDFPRELVLNNRINLDGGCVFGGELRALIIRGDTVHDILSIRAHRRYY